VQATGDVRICGGRAGSPSRKAQGVGDRRKSRHNRPYAEEAFAAKNRVTKVMLRSANCRHPPKTNGVR
jgi:hypothetical protein